MRDGLRLDGAMIPRRVKRLFDQRSEPRAASGTTALLGWRGTIVDVMVDNLSPSGAMLLCKAQPHIGEAVTLQLPDRAPVAAAIQWVGEGRIGIHFDRPVG